MNLLLGLQSSEDLNLQGKDLDFCIVATRKS